jgi:hypothetical protein
MTETRTLRRNLPIVLAASITTLAAFFVAAAPQPTDASWTVTKTFALTATAVIPAAPTALTCTASSGGLFTPIPFTWTAPAGTTPSGYTLKWTGAATGSNTWPTTSGSVPAAALIGNLQVRVYADYGNWQSAAGTPVRNASVLVAGLLWGCS